MASLTLTCPHCGGDIVLPATVVASNAATGLATVQLDQADANTHLTACRAAKAVEAAPAAGQPTKAELAGRVERFLAMRAYIGTGGSRACKLCGVNGTDCLDTLRAKGTPCCSGCGNGDTHPVPKGTLTCAEWAAEHHGAQD